MTDVEQKVVQMRFDDKEFDEKARKTMKTLDKLNEKLSFDAVAQKSDAALKDVTENVEKIANQAYTIVDRVIDKIKDSISTKIFNFISDALVGQVKTGWQKYADMTQAVGTLAAQGHKMEDINKTLERLAFFSDETNYNFNSMLNNIGKFTAAGVKLEDAEQALEGIAGMAGLSGVNAQRASVAMDQMAQAMGSYLKKADWVSIQTANLDTMDFRQTLIDTAVELGTLKKESNGAYVSLRATSKAGKNAFTVETGFLESLTQGAWATTDVMVETYKKYGAAVDRVYQKVEEDGITAANAINQLSAQNKILLKQYMAQYNVTEDVAIAELDKISMIRKATDEEIEQYAKLHKVSKKVAEATLNADYNKVLKDWQKTTHKTLEETEKELDNWAGWTNAKALKAFTNAQEARTFEDVINSVKEAVSSNWRSIYESIFGDYAEAKQLWSDMADGLVNLFAGRMYEIAAMFKQWKGLEPGEGGRTDLWQGLYAFAYGIRDIIQEVRDVWDSLISDGESGINVLSKITLKIKEAGFKFYIFVDQLINQGFFKDIMEALHNIKHFIDQVFGAFYDGFRDAMPAGGFFLNLLLEFAHILKELTSNFKLSDEAVDGLRRTFKGLTIILMKSKKTFVQLLVKVILPVLNAVFSILGQIVEVIVTITGTLGDILEYFMPLDSETSGLVTILEVLTSVLTEVIKLAGTGITWVLKKIVPLIGVVIGMVAGLIDGLGELFSAKKFKMGSGNNQLLKNFDALKERILDAWAPLKSFTDIIDEYKNGKGLVNFLNMFADITDGIGNRLLLTMDATIGFIETLGESKFGKVLAYALKALRMLVKGAIWLFNNLLVPILKEIIMELGLTIESVKGIIDERGIMGLLDLIQEMFKTGIFGALVNTINLFNGLIGSNGLGRLFSKGAKALESIASYFNAAKMNQAAEVMLKIVAAMGMLYVLLALITFLPTDHAEKMKDAMLEFGIALGIVVGGVFVISAAAALAGGNLIAMAAGFIGVALAIATALWALKNMVKFIDEVNIEVIDKGREKLMEILNAYSTFLFKTLGPLVLVSAKWNGNIGGVGIAMAGMAASIWLLMKTLKEVDSIDPAQIRNLFDALSGIYVVIAASTSLMILAAAGKDVHGISIAIASVGVAFAAIKMVLPLCKDIIAEKDVFLDGQAALATFGLFMLAFAASMYLVTSGVHGIITSMVSLLLFKAFANLIMDTVLPSIINLVKGLMEFSNTFAEYFKDTSTTFNVTALVVFITTIGAILAFLYAITGAFRMLFDTWADIDTVSMVAISVAVVGSLLIFSELLIPAVKKLALTVQGLSTGDFLSLASLLALMITPVIVIMHCLNRIIYNYSQMYGVLKNARFAVNIGIVNRQYSEIASMMSSMSTMIVGLYGLIVGFLYLTSKLTINETQLTTVKTILNKTFWIILAIVVPLCLMFRDIVDSLNMSVTAGKLYNINKSVGPAGVFSKVEDTATAIVKAVASTLQVVSIFIPGIVLIMGFLSRAVALENITDNFIKAMDSLSSIVISMMIGIGILAGILAYMAKSNPLETTATTASNTKYYALAAVMNAMKWIVIGILGTVTTIGLIAMIIGAAMNDAQFNQFKEALVWMTILVLGIMASFIGFIHLLTKPLRSMVNITDPSSQFRVLLVIAGSILSMVIAISVIAFQLLPVIQKFQSMDKDKMVGAFTGVITLLAAFIAGAIGIMAVGSKLTTTSTPQNLLAVLLTITSVLAPLLGMTLLIKSIKELVAAAQGMSADQIASLSLIVGAIGLIAIIIQAIGLVIGYSAPATAGTVIAGVAVVAALVAAIGLMAYLIGIAVEKIYAVYKDWILLQAVTSNFKNLGKYSAEGYAEGIQEGTKESDKAASDMTKSSLVAAGKAVHSKSPSKDFIKLGKFCDQGLAIGIERNTRDVVRASDALAKIPSEAFEDYNEIASPSKVFYKNGRFIVAGLSEGMKSGKSTLEDTMGELSNTISDSLNKGFENINIDIWGGEDPIEKIKNSIGDIDAGSIVGKMLGLDTPNEADSKLIEKYQKELDALNEKFPYGPTDPSAAQRMDWLKSQIAILSNKSLGTKIGEKVSGLLKSDTVKNLVADGAKALGIEITDAATSDEVLDSLGKKILGEEDNRTVVGVMFDKIKNGDWVGLGEDIGEGLVTGLKTSLGIKLMPIIRAFKRINPFDEKSIDDYFEIKTLESGRTVWESDSKDIAIYDGKAGSARYEFYNSFKKYTPEQIMNAINEKDFEIRLQEFTKALDNVRVWNDVEKKWIYHIDESCEAAIEELFKKWGISSPSKVTSYAYKMVGEGGVEGIEESTPKLVKAIRDQSSEEYRQLSLGLQGIDQLASQTTDITPSIVPMLDTSGLDPVMPLLNGDTTSRIEASLDHTNSVNMLAAAQLRIADAMDSFKRDVLAALNLGELIKVDVHNTVNDSNLFDHFVTIDRQEYNRTGRHAW